MEEDNPTDWDIDHTTIIHSCDNTTPLTINDELPGKNQVHKYAEINTIKKARQNKETYASLTTVAMARPIQEMKCIHNTLINALQEEHVYVRSTVLETMDTVEIGYFLGLQPSLTNLCWRGKQLMQRLGIQEMVPPFQIYRRQLRDEPNKTSCIVLHCAKADSKYLQNRFTNAFPITFGKGVEFVYPIPAELHLDQRKLCKSVPSTKQVH